MRTIKHLAFLLFAGLIILGSCKKSISPLLEAIPGNAAFVVALENKKLIDKGDFKNLKEYKAFQMLYDRVMYDPATHDYIDKFLANPGSLGLGIDQSYVFGVKQDDELYVAFVLEMNNEATFESALNELFKVIDIRLPQIEDKAGYKIAFADDELAFAWNKKLFFMVVGGDCESVDFAELFDMPIEKSILNVSDFAKFQKRSYDAGFWMSYGVFADMYTDFLGQKLPDFYKEMSDAYIHAYLNFEKGEMKITWLMSPESKVDAFMEKYPIIKKDFNTALLRDFPDKSYLCFKFSINVLEYFKLISEMSEQVGMGIGQMMLNDPTLNTVVNALGGDAIMSIYGFAQGPLPIPLVGLSFTVKSKDDFDKILALLPQEMLKQNGDHYVLSTGMAVSIYFAFKDNRVYITDDADAIASFTGKGFNKSLEKHAMGSVIKNSPSVFYINLDIDSYPENIRTLAQNAGGAMAGTFLSNLRPYKDFSISMVSNYEGVFSLKFKDESQNSLKQLLKSLDEIASSQIH